MKTIHHPSLSLFLAVIKGQSRILLHTQHFADSPTVTMFFFFHFENKIKALSTIYQPNLSFFKPSSKASRASFCSRNISRPYPRFKYIFFSLKVKIKTLSTTFMKTIHHPSLSLFLAVIKGQSRILLHTQHFADSPTVTMFFFFHFENKIKALSTIYQPNLSFFKPSSKASRVSFCTHNISRPHLQLQFFFFTSRTKSKLYQQFIH